MAEPESIRDILKRMFEEYNLDQPDTLTEIVAPALERSALDMQDMTKVQRLAIAQHELLHHHYANGCLGPGSVVSIAAMRLAGALLNRREKTALRPNIYHGPQLYASPTARQKFSPNPQPRPWEDEGSERMVAFDMETSGPVPAPPGKHILRYSAPEKVQSVRADTPYERSTNMDDVDFGHFERVVAASMLPEGAEIVGVDYGTHDETIVTVQYNKPLDYVMLNFEVETPPKFEELDKKMMLITYMPPNSETSDDFIYAVAWDADRMKFVQDKIEFIKKHKLENGLTAGSWRVPWESSAYAAGDDPDWNFPLVWPKSWDKQQNEEMGSDLFDIGDLLDAGTLRVGLVNAQSWRKWLGEQHDYSQISHTMLRVEVDEEGDARVWFEEWLPHADGHDELCATNYLTEKHIADLADATGTLDHLWV